MFAIIDNSYDYENIEFIQDENVAKEQFEEAKEEFDPFIQRSITLIKISGDGSFNMGLESEANNGVEIIDEVINEM